eukprot:TRINITY_DN306_c0_g1_i1.p1 TRINITY_DN306_c0_g1~~TRINITY_DN306_c0_g1_i1.p1  ORF type:complete len:213 (+),score=3.86 TRINITY_DN306_c0_g1_i1:469-1107(+)
MLIDAYNMIRSGRPKFTAGDREQADNYLIEGLEKWRQEMGFDKFILCGHSLGGYVAAKYAYQHPDRVLALILISPAGLWPAPSNFKQTFQAFLNRFGSFQRYFIKKALDYWSPGNSPLQLLRSLGRTSSLLLKQYVNWFSLSSEEERSDVREYLYHLLMKEGTGELAMPYILLPGAYGVDPLINTLNQLKVPITVFFGTNDWMASRNPVGTV